MPFGTMHHIETVTAPVLAVAQLTSYGARRLQRARRAPRGAILRPGPETPRWNSLVVAAAKLLRRRGDKAKLARVLGISRQRLHLLLKSRTACADAERTLLLQEWVEARRCGQDLA
jgi:inactivated superfamily I helicase